MWNGIDRRRFPRADYPCLIRLKKKNSPEVFSTHTENIGIGGICVSLEKDIGRFSEVTVELDLLDGKGLIVSDGITVWIIKSSIKYDTGIEFKDLKDEDRARINIIIERCLKTS